MTNTIRVILSFFILTTLGCPSAHQLPPPMKGKLVKRDFLEQGTLERADYGAYSYILIPRSPASDARYVALLSAFIELIPTDSHQAGSLSNQVNLTYAPVVAVTGTRDAEWLVRNYDVERAATLMHNLCLVGYGPYIVTVTAPLSSQAPRKCEGPDNEQAGLLVIDLATKSKEVMPAWLGHFIRASDGPRIWKRKTLELILMKIHDEMDGMGEAFGSVIEQLPGGGIAMRFLK